MLFLNRFLLLQFGVLPRGSAPLVQSSQLLFVTTKAGTHVAYPTERRLSPKSLDSETKSVPSAKYGSASGDGSHFIFDAACFCPAYRILDCVQQASRCEGYI
jgi:hypothetical protein